MKKRVWCLMAALGACLLLLQVSVFAANTGSDAQKEYTVTAQGGMTVRPQVIKNATSRTVIAVKSTTKDQKLPEMVKVKMGDAELTAEQVRYDRETGTVTIASEITDHITVIGCYPVSVISVHNKKTVREEFGYVDAGAEYTCQLAAPYGYVLPGSITVTVGGTTLKMDEDTTYSYDKSVGEVTLMKDVVNGEVGIQVSYHSGTLTVGNDVIYKYGTLQDYQLDGVSFDPDTQTLVLEDADISFSGDGLHKGVYGIYTDMDHLTIALKGNSVLTMPIPQGDRSYGVYAEGNLSIVSVDEKMPGVLTVTSADMDRKLQSVETCGIYANLASDGILIDGVVLDIRAGNAVSAGGNAKSYGICIDYCYEQYRGMHIQNSTVTVSSGAATAAGVARSAGIFSGDYDEDTITITNSTVNVKGGTAAAEKSATSYGVSCGGSVQLYKNSKVITEAGKAQSSSQTAMSVGFVSAAPLEVYDSRLIAAADTVLVTEGENGASTGALVDDLKLEDAELKAQGKDHALLGYGACDLGKEKWYRWTTEPDTGYRISSETPFKRDHKMTYLHILPINGEVEQETPEKDEIILAPVQFYDVHPVKHWATDAIDAMVNRGWMNGVEGSAFAPDMTATRSQIITILWRMAGEPACSQEENGTFADVPANTWYTEAVEWAASVGIVQGRGDGTFGPGDQITREQLAVMLYRYEQYQGGGFKGMWMFLLNYEDRAEVSDWAYEAVCWMTMNDVINGKADGKLDPKGLATRAEVAQMLNNYVKNNK